MIACCGKGDPRLEKLAACCREVLAGIKRLDCSEGEFSGDEHDNVVAC